MQSLWMLLAAFMFAIMGACIKLSYASGSTLALIVIARGVPSIVAILLWAVFSNRSLKPISVKLHFLRNLFGVSAMWMGFYGYSVLPLSTSTSLNYTSPLFIAGWLYFSNKGPKDHVRLLAVILGFLGVLLVLRPSITEDQWFAASLGVMSGAFAGIAMLQIRELGALGEPIWRTVFYFSLVVVVTGFLGLKAHGYGSPDWLTWIALGGVGVSGLIGQLALTRAFGAGSPILTAALQYSTIIFAAILGIVFWGDIPDLLAWTGMALIIAAGLLTAWRTMRLAEAAKKQ
ncbi:MAG: DMT family transporter [Alcaligenaceae bacterium]|nr:DMT family transporter [Alcaligenaceae bacterium]